MSDKHPNEVIWDAVYAGGQILAYPYEVAVRLAKRQLASGGFRGVVLDHGCGSGNHLEMFVRLGVAVHGTEVAPASRHVIAARFMGANLPQPPITIIDLNRPLTPQLPAYDHLFAWGSVHYNTKEATKRDLASLIDKTPVGGVVIVCIPSQRDVVFTQSVGLPDGSRQMNANVSGQKGAILTVPDSLDEMLGWCKGVDVKDAGEFGWRLSGRQSEFHFVYGVKSAT